MMFIRFARQRAIAPWLACLLSVSLVLAACGGAAEPVAEEPAATGEAETVTQPPAEDEAQIQEDQEIAAEEEVSAAEETSEETEVTPEEPTAEAAASVDDEPGQELAANSLATCRTVSPDNDPIAAVLQPNELIAPVSDSDWTKGPADALITVIEYGDFQ